MGMAVWVQDIGRWILLLRTTDGFGRKVRPKAKGGSLAKARLNAAATLSITLSATLSKRSMKKIDKVIDKVADKVWIAQASVE